MLVCAQAMSDGLTPILCHWKRNNSGDSAQTRFDKSFRAAHFMAQTLECGATRVHYLSLCSALQSVEDANDETPRGEIVTYSVNDYRYPGVSSRPLHVAVSKIDLDISELWLDDMETLATFLRELSQGAYFLIDPIRVSLLRE